MPTWPHTQYSLLARLADASDDAAWQTFEQIYQPAVYRYARNRGLQEADALEVVQEVMVAVHRAMDAWKPSHRTGSFRAWLAEAARRQTLQALRQRDRRDRATGRTSVRAAIDQIAVGGGQSADSVEADAQRWAFFCAAACVEQEVHATTWRAFWLTAVEGRPPATAAAELGMTVGNVYSAKCRVLDRIRRRVQECSQVMGDV